MNSLCTILVLLTHMLTYFHSPADSPATAIQLNIVHRFARQELKLDKEYHSHPDRLITFTRFKYYISNIELTRTDGTVWKPALQYYLIDINDEMPANVEILLKDVAAGTYKELSYHIGVDRIANHSGDQEGVLNPDYGMFWMWETGYTFFKIEGFYGNSQGSHNAMIFHVGRDECYRKVSLPLRNISVAGSTAPHIVTIVADVEKIFAPSADPLKTQSGGPVSIMSGEKSKTLAENFSKMFSVL